jgi:histidinol-phosphate phosphatase family protein
VRREVLLLLDRDGTLMEDVGYPNDPAEVRLIPGAAESIRELVLRGFVPAIVSNQSGIARGIVSPEQAKSVHDRFIAMFAEASGIRLPAYYCPHGPDDGCDCRKPEIGLLQRAADELGMAGRPAVMIGDKDSDVDAGRRFGARTIRFGLDRGEADFASNNWSAVGDFVLNRELLHVGR